MHSLIVIAVAGTPKAIERLLEGVDRLVEEQTMQGGIDGLTTEVIRGATSDAAREALRSAQPKRRAKKS